MPNLIPTLIATVEDSPVIGKNVVAKMEFPVDVVSAVVLPPLTEIV